MSVKKATSNKAAMSRDFETENSNARNKCLGESVGAAYLRIYTSVSQ